MTDPRATTEPLLLVPARGGSRRVPRKNVRTFLDESALERVLRMVREAGFSDPVVSTDDAGIAQVARAAGARVPFERPPELSGDRATTVDVVRHALGELFATDARPYATVVVYPTALLLPAARLRQAYEEFCGADCDFVVPVIESPQPVERALRLGPDRRIEALDVGPALARTQDLPRAYFDAGQFYIGRSAAWLETSPLASVSAIATVLSRLEAVDIDTEDDWALAERIARGLLRP